MSAQPPKNVMAALEKVFTAEIHNQLPFQSKATIFNELLANGLVERMEKKFGTGLFAARVRGFALTHAGRHLYCSNCKDKDNG